MPLTEFGISYQDSGVGPAVLLIAGTGARGRTWHLHQVPALVQAGFRVVTYDTRGLPPSAAPPVVTFADQVADAIALIEQLGLGPCRVAGSSMGARVAAEVCLERPDLVDRAVLMATFGRPNVFRAAMDAAEASLQGLDLPAEHLAMVRAVQNLSPRTLADDGRVRDWLDIFQLAPASGDGSRLENAADTDRLDAYAKITVPCLVIGFADDVIAPAEDGRAVAAAIPGARYAEIPAAGHYGYLEQPERLNDELIAYLHNTP